MFASLRVWNERRTFRTFRDGPTQSSRRCCGITRPFMHVVLGVGGALPRPSARTHGSDGSREIGTNSTHCNRPVVPGRGTCVLRSDVLWTFPADDRRLSHEAPERRGRSSPRAIRRKGSARGGAPRGSTGHVFEEQRHCVAVGRIHRETESAIEAFGIGLGTQLPS